MKPDLLATLRAERCQRSPAGDWLCSRCGAVPLGDAEILCLACETEAEEERATAERERQRQQWIQRVRARGDRATGRLPNWPHLESPEAFAEAVKSPALRSVAERWEPSRGSLLLLGPSGEGKTSSAARSVRRLRDARVSARLANPRDPGAHAALDELSRFMWVSASELCRALSQHPLGSRQEADLITAAVDASALFVDELGPEPARYVGDLFDIVDRRTARSAPTVCTSGMTEAAFRERYGDAFVRRLTEKGLGFLIDAHPKESPRRNVG